MAATRLYFTASIEEQWRNLVGPWLREQARTAWKNPEPTVILTPSRAEGFYLRSRLVDEGISFLGLRFWTPSDARKFLLAEILPEIGAATQAELRLITRAAAEKLMDKTDHDKATLTSVIREPGPFLRAYDLLLGAGWNPAEDGAAYGRGLARGIQADLEEFHIATQAALHRDLWRKTCTRTAPLIANLLVVGFNAAHWLLWNLLKAVVFSSHESVLALSEPRVFAEEIDQLWISSWEEITQTEALYPADPMDALPDESNAPFAGLVASYEKGEFIGNDKSDLTFCVTPDLASQVRAVVLQALDYLRRDSCTRLGIIFPEANPLAMGVAEELRRLNIPLDDGTGLLLPGIFERRCWQSWLALQEEPGVARLIQWVRACEAEGVSLGEEKSPSAREIADVLESALGESLVDDLNFLTRQLEGTSDRRVRSVADFLRSRAALPASAIFLEFLGRTREALMLPGWENYLARLWIDPPEWLWKNKRIISLRAFLGWLKESTTSQLRTRGAEGNHFYGRVHLGVYSQMTGQSWSHLILTGLNEGVWPKAFEANAFGSRHELATLNRQARQLNRLGVGQGGQGMGHETVGADRGHCLLPLERQDLGLRDLCNILEATGAAACLAAMTTEGGRNLLPSDFFSHAYQAKTGQTLDEDTFRNLANATEERCLRHPFIFESTPTFSPDTASATQLAYRARRNPTQSFGPFEFSFAQPPAQPIQLSCKEWETAWNHPPAVWLEKIVGAPAWPEGRLSWSRAIGTWAHRWLANSLRECHEQDSAKDFLPLLLEAADREANTVQRRARESAIDLYPWWEQVWRQARNLALGLGETLAPHLQERKCLGEFRLPSGLNIALPGIGQDDFELKGRIDLLLVQPGALPYDLMRGDFSGCACWVVDFKTGSAQSLTAKKMEEGRGLQPLLYGLAVRALGASSTAISLHTRDTQLQPQLRLDEALETTTLFRSLDKFHRDGVFGMRPDADNAYGYSPSYPMATRFVPTVTLEAKWALVHGIAAAMEKEEE